MNNRCPYFIMVVRDRETGRGVPLMELELPNGIRYLTDSGGTVAFSEISFMGRQTLFRIRGPGYRYPVQHLGEPGIVLTPFAGSRIELSVQRTHAAERLYRVTGEGIYHDSELSGDRVPIRNPWINAGVVGQDTVIALPYRGKIYWFWGDTLGTAELNLNVAGAVSELFSGQAGKPSDGPAPADGVDLTYFEDARGFAKPLCPFGGAGRIWLDWALTLADEAGRERLVAGYSRMTSLNRIAEQGIAVFNDDTEVFESLATRKICRDTLPHRVEHPIMTEADGTRYIVFSARFGFRRVAAELDPDQLLNPDAYEVYGPVPEKPQQDAVTDDREPDRTRVHGWRKGASAPDLDLQQQWLSEGSLDPADSWLRPTDIDSGAPVTIYPGSIAWNPYQKRWILIAQGNLGDVWFGCADSLVGPWVYCKKIAGHDCYSFYNPVHHPFFDEDRGRTIYFEGTYCNWFTDNREKTPRYDYNQLMYRLQLDRPEIALPVPVYRLGGRDPVYTTLSTAAGLDPTDQIEKIPFFAIPAERSIPGLISIYPKPAGRHTRLSPDLPIPADSPTVPLFLALPAELRSPEQTFPGTWRCEARGDWGNRIAFSFHLTMEQHGPNLSFQEDFLTVLDIAIIDRRLVLHLSFSGRQYRLNGEIKAGNLTGRWLCRETGESGTWDGKRSDFAGLQLKSPAVTPLFEYLGRKDQAPVYCTRPSAAIPGYRRTEKPICRVWRNPLPRFVPDLSLRPVGSERPLS